MEWNILYLVLSLFSYFSSSLYLPPYLSWLQNIMAYQYIDRILAWYTNDILFYLHVFSVIFHILFYSLSIWFLMHCCYFCAFDCENILYISHSVGSYVRNHSRYVPLLFFLFHFLHITYVLLYMYIMFLYLVFCQANVSVIIIIILVYPLRYNFFLWEYPFYFYSLPTQDFFLNPAHFLT